MPNQDTDSTAASAAAAAKSADQSATAAIQAAASATAAAASATAAATAVSVGTSAAQVKYHHNKDTYLARYAEHNARLQTWIGGYGAGLASLLVYQFRTAIGDAKELWKSATGADNAPVLIAKTTSMHSQLSCALTLIAIALGFQVVLLYLNKATQFSITHSDEDESKWNWWEKLSESFSGLYLFDALCDVGSISLLGLATYEGIRALGLVT
jgi:hypothetical protein